jgi:allophanate hydrolase subunit 2
MAPARFVIKTVGPLVTIQDHGRYGFLRYGVPESGPMDRDAFEIAHAALGYDAGGAAIEVSLGGIALECVEGSVTLAIAGGGFAITLDKTAVGSWSVVNVRAGSSVTIHGPALGGAGRTWPLPAGLWRRRGSEVIRPMHRQGLAEAA